VEETYELEDYTI